MQMSIDMHKIMLKEGEKVIYEKIKHLCKERKISIYRVEKDLELSNCSICKWKTSKPTVYKLQKVANYFDVSIEYFLEEDKEVK